MQVSWVLPSALEKLSNSGVQMRSYVSRDQRGFTLIEMSIVLVIIGLIVGGILKGQEVIESARQKNMAALYDQIRSAQNTFLDRYRALPGDYKDAESKINTLAKNGDGDGFVDETGVGPVATIALLAAADGTTGENLQYFQHLVAAGLFGGGQLADGTTVLNFSGSGTDQSPLPTGPWTSSGLTMVHGTHTGDASATQSTTAIWLRLSTFGTSVAATNAVLTGASAFQFDTKFDDGLPATGRIRNLDLTENICGSSASNKYTISASANKRECEIILSAE